jgi:hypothetical protein
MKEVGVALIAICSMILTAVNFAALFLFFFLPYDREILSETGQTR